MSLTQGLKSPLTPLRRFLDREVSAGTRRVRAAYRAHLPYRGVFLPSEGVGFKAGTVRTAMDQRLRLAFTAAQPLDGASAAGITGGQAVARIQQGRGRGDGVWVRTCGIGR